MCLLYRTQHGLTRTNLRFVNTMVTSNVATNKRMEFHQQLLRQKRNHGRHHQSYESGTSVSVDEEERLCDDSEAKSSVRTKEEEERSILQDAANDQEDTYRHDKASLRQVTTETKSRKGVKSHNII